MHFLRQHYQIENESVLTTSSLNFSMNDFHSQIIILIILDYFIACIYSCQILI